MANRSAAGTSRTWPRRVLIALFWARPPRLLMPVAWRLLARLVSFSEWVHSNAEVALIEVEDRL